MSDPATSGGDQEVECADLDEALTHLRELILNEMADGWPDGARFERYGVRPSDGFAGALPTVFASD